MRPLILVGLASFFVAAGDSTSDPVAQCGEFCSVWARVEGRVVDEAGDGLALARVEVLPRYSQSGSDPCVEPFPESFRQIALADSTGAFGITLRTISIFPYPCLVLTTNAWPYSPQPASVDTIAPVQWGFTAHGVTAHQVVIVIDNPATP